MKLHKLVALVCASSLAGCSFGMRSAPSPYQPAYPPNCTESAAAPTVDLFGALGSGGIGILSLVAASELDDRHSSNVADGLGDALGTILFTLIGVAGLASGTVFAVSSMRGFDKRSKCKDVQAAHTRYLQDRSARPAAPSPAQSVTPTDTTRCYPNNTCNPGLICQQGMCTPGPDEGTEGGRCYRNKTCNGGLVCAGQSCILCGPLQEQWQSETDVNVKAGLLQSMPLECRDGVTP